ncbi:MAG: isoaspartyl peptidase/L-asparaginase [Balneolaceae bacterium]|nr:isoaspartyl peptidase/L-asparaginase [Balneolaceae bacterium]
MYKVKTLIIALIIVLFGNIETSAQDKKIKEWAIALHGGAGYYPKDAPAERTQAYMEALDEALAIGTEILESGGNAMDAVEATIQYLENNELFNAGRGAVFTAEGKNELDAAFMHGNTLNAGAITGVTTVKNPISLARKVMEESNHVFFASEGAEIFADQTNVERVDPLYFRVEEKYERWKRNNAGQGYNHNDSETENGWKMGTVGAVAVDSEGNIVAGTSTGGMTNKKFGRVGDVPIIGSGTYANDLVAVSATGWGERIMLNVSAHALAMHMQFTGSNVDEAMNYLVDDLLNPREAGFIAVDKYGNISMRTNTGSMFQAAADSEGFKKVAIWED